LAFERLGKVEKVNAGCYDARASGIIRTDNRWGRRARTRTEDVMTRIAFFPAALSMFLATWLLAACGSGSPPQMASHATTTTLPSGGVYKGTAVPGRDATLLVLFDGSAYLFYAPSSPADKNDVGGVVVARNGVQSGSGQFQSASARNYDLQLGRISPGALSINFSGAPAIEGVMRSATGEPPSLRFNATSDQMLGQPISLGSIAGLYVGWAGSLVGTARSRITVTDGFVAGTTSTGCVFRGTVAPHDGVNAYDVSITFGPSPCPAAGVKVAGSAVLAGPHLLVALPSADASDVFVFDGSK
jgi:hypothetical protein